MTSASPAVAIASFIVGATRTVEPGGAASRMSWSSVSLMLARVSPSVTKMLAGPSSFTLSIGPTSTGSPPSRLWRSP